MPDSVGCRLEFERCRKKLKMKKERKEKKKEKKKKKEKRKKEQSVVVHFPRRPVTRTTVESGL